MKMTDLLGVSTDRCSLMIFFLSHLPSQTPPLAWGKSCLIFGLLPLLFTYNLHVSTQCSPSVSFLKIILEILPPLPPPQLCPDHVNNLSILACGKSDLVHVNKPMCWLCTPSYWSFSCCVDSRLLSKKKKLQQNSQIAGNIKCWFVDWFTTKLYRLIESMMLLLCQTS